MQHNNTIDDLTAISNGGRPENDEATTRNPDRAGNIFNGILDALPVLIGAGTAIAGTVQTGRQNNGAQPAPAPGGYYPAPAPAAQNQWPTFFEENKTYLIGGAMLVLAAIAAYVVMKK